MQTHAMNKSRTTWATAALVATLAMAMTVTTASASDVEEECKKADGTPRPCTTSEKALACIDNAIGVYHECTDKGGFLNDAICFVRYEVDFYGCVPEVLLPK